MSNLYKMGSLDVLEKRGQSGAPVIIVFHGFGADAYDLLSLSQLVEVPVGTSWIFAQGPLKVSDGGIAGRAWFPLDVQALDRAVRAGIHYDFSGLTPPGLRQAREQVMDLISTLGVPVSKIVLMGFSQGAMLATDVALRLREKPAALVILSGGLLNKDLWAEKAKGKAGLPFFQSHGDSDTLLSYKAAEDLSKILLDADLKGQFHGFHGGHEVPQEIIHKLGVFLKKTLALQN